MTTERDRIQHRTADEAETTVKTVAIDLDAFLALSTEDRATRWRQWDRSAKFQAVAQMLARRFGDWDPVAVEHHIARYDERWGTAPISDTAIPSAEEIADLAKERSDLAQQHGDWAGAAQLNRLRVNVLRRARLCWHLGDLLISSLNTPGAIYSVNRRGCSCPNGRAGKAQCWHVALYDLLLDMQQTAADTADMEADRAAELALRDRIVAARRRQLEAA